MFIHIRDNQGNERFVAEADLESGIASGEIVAFRRSAGWISIPDESRRGSAEAYAGYTGQERRRSLLSRKRAFPETPAFQEAPFSKTPSVPVSE